MGKKWEFSSENRRICSHPLTFWQKQLILVDYSTPLGGTAMLKKWDVTIPTLTGDKPRKAYVYLPEY